MKYYKQLDSIRFFAAISVLTAHWFHYINVIDLLRLGHIGLDFFFVLSGFLISYQLLELGDSIRQQKVDFLKGLGNFIARRSLRIFPLYYVVLFTATLFNHGEIRDAFVYNLFYVSNFYFMETQHWSNIFSHFWSLSVEEHFYLLWPLLILISRKRFLPFLFIGIVIFSISFRFFHFINTYDYFTVHIHTFSCLDLFVYGAVLAYCFFLNKDTVLHFFSIRTTKIAIIGGWLIGYATMIAFRGDQVYIWVFFRVVVGILSAGLIGLLVVGFKGLAGAILENKWLVMGGKLSYAIYLVHGFVPGMLLAVKKLDLPILIEFLIYFSATLVISLVLHKIVENPLHRMGRKYKIDYH